MHMYYNYYIDNYSQHFFSMQKLFQWKFCRYKKVKLLFYSRIKKKYFSKLKPIYNGSGHDIELNKKIKIVISTGYFIYYIYILIQKKGYLYGTVWFEILLNIHIDSNKFW